MAPRKRVGAFEQITVVGRTRRIAIGRRFFAQQQGSGGVIEGRQRFAGAQIDVGDANVSQGQPVPGGAAATPPMA